MAPASVQL